MKPKIFTPAVTVIMDNGKPDMDGNIKLAETLIKGGVDGIVPMGSTGEFPYFKNNDEKKAYLAEYISAIDGRVELLVGTGGIGYKETVELSDFVLKRGVKGVLIICESYFNMNQNEFYRYYSYMAENIDGDVYIYNYPVRTGNNIEAETVVRLADKYKNIKGMKDSILDFSHTEKIIKQVLPVRPDFEVYSGFDHQFLENHKLGGAGGVGALSNIVPKVWSKWVKDTAEENALGVEQGLARISELMKIYDMESNPQKILKEILKREGVDINTFCHGPYNYLNENSLENAMELLGDDAYWLEKAE